MTYLLPREIVSELDRHIVGQNRAKRAVAIALRNRWRRQMIKGSLHHEILPKNILMLGPTGVGKTEIARRLAKLAAAPFIKVEATKFTEIGYVGRDVEQIIRDLLEIAIALVRTQKSEHVKIQAAENAENRILDVLTGTDSKESTRSLFREKFRRGDLDTKNITLEVPETHSPHFEIPGVQNATIGMISFSDLLDKTFKKNMKTCHLSVREGYELILAQESDKLLDHEQIKRQAISLTENEGIVFLDEIDKLCPDREKNSGNISREGVQRDLLPLIEGTTVPTKHGSIKTDHILFIASGAFHISRPADLLAELQGRLPVRVELDPLSSEDFVRILTEPEANLIKQYVALLATEGVQLSFTDDAVKEIADKASYINSVIENIGARRLHSLMEHILEDISFTAPECEGKEIVLRAEDVAASVDPLIKRENLSRFIL